MLMTNSIYLWLSQPGNGVVFTDTPLINQEINPIDEEKWFEALEMGCFEVEYRRLEDKRWIYQVSAAHSWSTFERGPYM
jgi:hypothetical protein